MIKTIFLDYTGTMVREDDPLTKDLVGYFVTHSDIKDPQEVIKIVWSLIKKIESVSFGDGFVLNDEKVDRIMEYCSLNCGLKGDFEYIHNTWRRIWVEAPLFDDVKPFFERTAVPIYIISNDDLKYLNESMRLKDIHPAGIISAETVRACKPHKTIFEKALEVAGVRPEEAVHIGDSITSDVEPAKALGINPIYLARKEKAVLDGITVISSLDEVVNYYPDIF